MTAKKLTAEELAVKMEMGNHDWADDAADMLRQQQAEIEKLGSELDRIVELYTDKAIENEALKKARCVACGWNPNLIGGEK
jgi:uncharacterized protein YecA (UPF0149 family)